MSNEGNICIFDLDLTYRVLIITRSSRLFHSNDVQQNMIKARERSKHTFQTHNQFC